MHSRAVGRRVGEGRRLPLRAERRRLEIVGERKTMPHVPARRLGQNPGRVRAILDHRPTVLRPFNGHEQGAPAEGPVAVLVGMIEDPPAPVLRLKDGTVPLGPPFLAPGGRPQERIVGRILPGPGRRLGARNNDQSILSLLLQD